MKKFLAAVLAAAMILSLTGCSLWDVIPTKGTNEGKTTEEETKETGPSYESTAVTEETEALPSSESSNSGFYSMLGTAARLGEYTYFVSNGLNNDCSWNGSAYSADIWRIRDAANAKPELVYSAASSVVFGTEQETIYFLAAGNGRLWFIELQDRESKELALHWLDPDTLNSGKEALPISLYDLDSAFDTEAVYFDGDCYYFLTAMEEEYLLWCFDTADASCRKISLNKDKEDSVAVPFAVSQGYAYYCLWKPLTGDVDDAVYRCDLATLAREKVCDISVKEELDSADFFYASKNYLYYHTDEVLYAVRLKDGEKLTVADESEGLADEYYPTWCITDEEIWYASPEGIFLCDADGSNARKIASDPAKEDKMGLFVSDEWIWYSMNDHPEYARVMKNARNFPEEPLVSAEYNSIVKEGDNGQWEYEVFPSFVRVNAVKEPEGAVEIPETIDGLPVRSLRCWMPDGFHGAYTLTLPEGLVSCGYVYAKGVTRIELPKSIETFTHRGFTYSFRTDAETTFVYPGTLEEFKAVCRHSSALYCDMGIDADCASTVFILECKDGLFTCEPSPDGKEIFVPYEEEEDILITWLGIWTCENGEKIEIDVADEDQGLQLIYHGFTAAGSPLETAYSFAFENDEMTVAGEDKSVEQSAGWRYVLVLDPKNGTLTMKSRYPDRIFTKED